MTILFLGQSAFGIDIGDLLARAPKPGDPNDSYMVQKIEGASGILGNQMPLGETPLPQATINAIRQWITAGVFAVQATAPLDSASVKAPLARIVVTFTQDVDASLVNGTTVTLERMPDAARDSAADAATP